MKLAATICAMLLASIIPSLGENALEREMEDYARDFYRAYPDAAGDVKPRQAAANLLKKLKVNKILDLTRDQEKQLRKKEDVVSETAYTTAIENLKGLGSKEPNIMFLLKYADREDLKPVEKLLIYRLNEIYYHPAAEKSIAARKKVMSDILKKYKDYNAEERKAPASLADLDLPEGLKQFLNPITGEKMDWIYIGHRKRRITAHDSHIVLAEPVGSGQFRLCGLDNGKVGTYKENSISKSLEKILTTPDPIKKPGGGTAPTGSHPEMATLKSLMKKYVTYRKEQKKSPKALADLELSDDEKSYKDPETGDLSDWIFLGKKSPIQGKDRVPVVIVAPKGYKGKRIAGLHDGRTVSISDASISKLLERIEAKKATP